MKLLASIKDIYIQIMENVKQSRISVYLVTSVVLVTLIGPYAADWNETHIYNPRWPPHAKFHNAQTMLLGTLLALGAMWYLWKPASNPLIKKNNFNVAIFLASAYWITQSLSILFPCTGFTDPEFGEIARFIDIPAQLLFDIPIFIVLFVAYYLSSKANNER